MTRIGEATICATLVLWAVTVFAVVQVGTAPLDNMPLMLSDAQYAQVTNGVARAKVTVYRLEMTDGVPYVVGVDNVRRPVVLVDPAEWAAVTNVAFREIERLNSTEDGRIRLHGPRRQQIVDDERHEKATVYEDGHVHVEKMSPVLPAAHPPASVRASGRAPRPSYSQRYREMLESRAAKASAKPRTVTVEHDAATGKDIVK